MSSQTPLLATAEPPREGARPCGKRTWKAAGLVGLGLLLVTLVPAGYDRYSIGPLRLQGYARSEFIRCTLRPFPAIPCPSQPIECPAAGRPLRRMLLLSDGLTTPNMEQLFQQMLQAASDAGARQDGEKRVLLVLDAAYAAFFKGVQFTSPREYCSMRRHELSALGASAVTCVILDPAAREHLWQIGLSKGGESEEFGAAMHVIDDDFILRELRRASAVWLEMGSPGALLTGARRQLHIKSKHGDHGKGYKTFEDALRDRVLDGSGSLAYVGASGGSIVAGDLVSFALSGEMRSEDIVGFRLASNCSFSPHATQKDDAWLHSYSENHHTTAVKIPDCQALVDFGEGLNLGYTCE
mmetsp:Transcript_56585/g.143193  ORF Transcript_56585/g.143193 Transcript_56585/m.143193 type:complete len:354 (-) Transcript_56585:150-1211(-)